MEPLSDPANTLWPFPFTPQDRAQTPLAVQAYVRVGQGKPSKRWFDRTSRNNCEKWLPCAQRTLFKVPLACRLPPVCR